MKPHPQLVDAQALGREKPATFQVPPERRLALLGELGLEPYVKVCLSDEESGERFWVKVTGCDAGVYSGIVSNDLGGPWDVTKGDVIRFESRHVYDTRFKGELE